jgi:hypothetical protein
MATRLDRRGRRIGHNWWREYVVQVWRDAHDAWWKQAEHETMLYATELAEYNLINPQPRFRDFLVGLKEA